MASITGTTPYQVEPNTSYVISVTGYSGQETHIEYFQAGGWIEMANTRKFADWGSRDMVVPTNQIRIVYDTGSGTLDVELSPKKENV